MKRHVLFFLLLSVVAASFAQKRFSEGVISYSVTTVLGADTVDAGMRYTETIKGWHYRADLFSDLVQVATFFDTREDTGALIKTVGTNEILTPLTRANWNEINSRFINASYETTSQQKEVLGFACTLAKAVLKDGTQMEVYFTPALSSDNAELSIRFTQLRGMVLEFTAKTGNTSVTYTAVSLSFDPVPIQRFDLPASDFKILGYEESKQL